MSNQSVEKLKIALKGLQHIGADGLLNSNNNWSDESFLTTYQGWSYKKWDATALSKMYKIWYTQLYETSILSEHICSLMCAVIEELLSSYKIGTPASKTESPDYSIMVDLLKDTAIDVKQDLMDEKEKEKDNDDDDDAEEVKGIGLASLESEGNKTASNEVSKKSYLMHLLRQSESPNETVKSDAIGKLRNIMGFQALVLVRLIVKTTTSVNNYLNTRFSGVVQHLFPNVIITGNINAPSEKFMSLFSNMIRKGNEKSKMVFIPLLKYYKQVLEKKDDTLKGIMDAGCMIHLKGNGIGLVTLALGAAMSVRKDFEYVLGRLMSRETLVSVERLVTHSLIYMAKDTKDVELWWWARLVEDNYFTNLTIKSNQQLCLYLVSILAVGESDNVDIFNIIGLQGISEELKDEAKDIALQFVHSIRGKKDEFYGDFQPSQERSKKTQNDGLDALYK